MIQEDHQITIDTSKYPHLFEKRVFYPQKESAFVGEFWYADKQNYPIRYCDPFDFRPMDPRSVEFPCFRYKNDAGQGMRLQSFAHGIHIEK